jgi:aminoglycoside phosphotransferase (APT) family kinase protein
LWGGYGEILRVDIAGGEVESVIVKSVKPPTKAKSDASDARKRRSYEVERVFYESFAARCSEACRVPRFFGAQTTRGRDAESVFVLEDLDAAGYAGRRRSADFETLDRCLAWLAAFHATFFATPPNGLWATGTYWHLATRRDELANVDGDLRALAPRIDAKLASGIHRTLVHGDAKLANFCFARDGLVAAVDFQYVGGGCGMKDVAYLVSGEPNEARALDAYFRHLRRELESRSIAGEPVEAEWRALYPFACADFYRFLAGWSPGHFAGDRHARRVLENVAKDL